MTDHPPLVAVLLIVLLTPLALAIWLSTELFLIRVKDGQARVVRGRLPPTVLTDLRDVFTRSKETGWVRVTVVRRVATVKVRGGFSPETVQRVRNVIGAVPLQRLRAR